MKKKIILILFMFFLFRTNTYALTYTGCDASTVARMKQIVSNVNTTYNYRIVNNKAYFDLTISNLTNDIYVTDNLFGREYYNFSNGELTIRGITTSSITIKYYSRKNECRGLMLGIKYEQFPIYNQYHTHEVCKDMEGFSYCEKWVKKAYTLDEIKAAIKKYNEGLNEPDIPTNVIYKKSLLDRLIEFYVKYYYIVLTGVIIVCGIAIFVKKRKNQFKI